MLNVKVTPWRNIRHIGALRCAYVCVCVRVCANVCMRVLVMSGYPLLQVIYLIMLLPTACLVAFGLHYTKFCANTVGAVH